MSPCAALLTLLLLAGSGVTHPSTTLRQNTNQLSASGQPLRTLGTLGILFGSIEAEAAVEQRLERLLQDLDRAPMKQLQHLQSFIDGTLRRGQIAMEILGTGLDLIASHRPDARSDDYRRILLARTQEMMSDRRVGTVAPNNSSSGAASIRLQVDRQMVEMRHQLAPRIARAVRTLGEPNAILATNLAASLGTELIQRLLLQLLPKPIRFEDLLGQGLKAHVQNIFRNRRQDEQDPDENELAVSVDTDGRESSESESSEESDGPGGLVGLIASLSGGDEGSDVGALIGSLSAVITNLFGPGGLDVPGLLGTGTSLIAGLLGGDDNFGKVLGSYVGIAIEGLSGGGADMNGAFFGNFLGALIAALSSDPEDDNLPLRPKLFVQNFFSGLEAAKRKGDPNDDAEKGGSDLFAFLGNIVSSVVGGITSLVLNASLGSSGGSSQGSADASGASSAGSSGGDHPHPAT